MKIYKKLNSVINAMRNHYKLLGVIGPVALVIARLFRFTPILRARISGIRLPLLVRVGKTDVSCALQVLQEKQYDYPINFEPRMIIDAGANIGSASVFFANKFPNARIIAIEPEASNVAMLRRNTAGYPNVEIIAGALWHKTGTISLVDPCSGHHGFQTHEVGDNLVRAVTIDELLKNYNADRVDILKIDIEGAEAEVFAHSTGWICRVSVIMAELHPQLRHDCEEIFNQATKGYEVRDSFGETVLCM